MSAQRLSTQRLPQSSAVYALRAQSRRLVSTTSADRATPSPVQGTEFSFADIVSESKTPQTLTEKIVQEHAVGLPEGKVIRSGDYVQIEPHRCMSHDNTAAILNKFRSLGAKRIKNPNQLVFAIDHDVQNKSASNLAKYEKIAAFAEEHGVPHYPAGHGIGHQVMVGSPWSSLFDVPECWRLTSM